MGSLIPGANAFVIVREPTSAIEGRSAGFEVRDTVLILSTGPKARYAFLFRKPTEEPTVLDELIETGVGSYNVTACRIGWGSDAPSQDEWNSKGSTGAGSLNIGQNNEAMRKAYAEGAISVPTGRWPPNVLLVHDPNCVRAGTKRVQATSIHGTSTAIRRSGAHSAAGGHQTIGREQPVRGYADEDGLEPIEAWQCMTNCAVLRLDQQSGQRLSTLAGRADPRRVHSNPGDNHGASLFGGGNSNVYADSGGASRYYPQFGNDDEMIRWIRRLLAVPREFPSIRPAPV